jgi:hypothetical protein
VAEQNDWERIVGAVEAMAPSLVQTNTPATPVGDGITSAFSQKEPPTTKVFHFTKYDVQTGRVVDYHVDQWRADASRLIQKLGSTYPSTHVYAGRRVWGLTLPDGATRPERTIYCAYPGCPSRSSTPEEMRLHERAYHGDWFRSEEERRKRESEESQLTVLREQNDALLKQAEANQQLVGAMAEQLKALQPIVTQVVTKAAKEAKR